MSNVVVLNFSYDVPVKLYSAHLLAMAVFLTLPDLRRLANMFLFNRRVEPVEFRPLFERTWLNSGALVFGTVLVIASTGFSLFGAYSVRQTSGDLAPRSELNGIWNVAEFEVNGENATPIGDG